MALLRCVLLVAACFVQPAADDDGVAILDRARQACLAVHSVQYRSREERPAGKDNAVSVVDALVRQRRAEVPSVGPADGMFFAEGVIREPGQPDEPFGYSYDGSQLRTLSLKDKAVTTKAHPSAMDVGRLLDWRVSLLLVPPFTSARPFTFGEAITVDHVTNEGQTKVGDVPCLVIAIQTTLQRDGQKSSQVTRWAFGEKDNLPRRIDFGKVWTKTITDLEIDPPLGNDAFVLAAPPDYSDRESAPKDDQLSGSLLAIGAPAPAWSLPDSSGTVHSLAGLRGKAVLIDFSASWCGPCKRAMPAIQDLHTRYKDRGLEVVCLDVFEKEGGSLDAYFNAKGYTYLLVHAGDDVAASYGVKAIPALYLVDGAGNVALAHAGYDPDLDQVLIKAI